MAGKTVQIVESTKIKTTFHYFFRLEFYQLDNFLDQLLDIQLDPVIELMSHKDLDYEEVVRNTLFRYIMGHGLEEIKRWHFETWNEPDLKIYNVHNFSEIGKRNIDGSIL